MTLGMRPGRCNLYVSNSNSGLKFQILCSNYLHNIPEIQHGSMSFINEGKLVSAIFLSWCNTSIVNKIFFGQYHYFPYLTESKTESE